MTHFEKINRLYNQWAEEDYQRTDTFDALCRAANAVEPLGIRWFSSEPNRICFGLFKRDYLGRGRWIFAFATPGGMDVSGYPPGHANFFRKLYEPAS